MSETTVIAEFTKTEAALTALEVKYKKVPDADTPKGYQACVEAIKELRPLRTGLDKVRLQLNAEDQWRIKFRNGEAKRITERLISLENPMKAAKQSVDDEAERIEEEKRQVEIARIEAITARINGLKMLTAQGSVEQLQAMLAKAKAIKLSEFQEFYDQAFAEKGGALQRITNALAERKKLEAQQAEQTRIAQEQTDRQTALDKQAEEQRQLEKAAQAELKAEQDKVREQQALIDKQKREEEESRLTAEREEAAKVKAEKDRLQCKVDAQKKEELEKEQQAAEIQRQKELRPDKEKLMDYAESINDIDVPAIKDEKLQALLGDYAADLVAITNTFAKRVKKA